MAILFDFYESPPQEGEEGKMRVYPRPVLSQTVGTEEIAAIIQQGSSLTKGDVYSTLISLGQVLSNKLQDGQRVHLNGIGYFSVTLQAYNIQTEKDLRADNVGFKSIEFRADKQLKNELKKARVRRSPIRSYSIRLTDEEVNRSVAEYFKENVVMTRRHFQEIWQLKKGMALKHIHRLLDEGKIKNVGTQRQPVYVAGVEEDLAARHKTHG